MSETPKEREPWPSPEVATPKPAVTQTTPDESKQWAEKYGEDNPERKVETKDEKEYSLRQTIEAKEPNKSEALNVVAWSTEETATILGYIADAPTKDASVLAQEFLAKHPGKPVEVVQAYIFKLRNKEANAATAPTSDPTDQE